MATAIGTGAGVLKFTQEEDFFASESPQCQKGENVLRSSWSRLVFPSCSISAQLDDWRAKPQHRKSICHTLFEFNIFVS